MPQTSLTVGFVPGGTPAKWARIWAERHPDVPLHLRTVAAADAAADVRAGAVDLAVLRPPADTSGLAVIPLYEETTVAVFPVDAHLAAVDELDRADLAGEVLIVPADDVLGAVVAGADAPGFDPPATALDAVEIVAAGIGVVLLPMSIARAHRRRDVDTRVVRDGPLSAVALAWPAARTTPEVEAFVGIVRGRTANSSR